MARHSGGLSGVTVGLVAAGIICLVIYLETRSTNVGADHMLGRQVAASPQQRVGMGSFREVPAPGGTLPPPPPARPAVVEVPRQQVRTMGQVVKNVPPPPPTSPPLPPAKPQQRSREPPPPENTAPPPPPQRPAAAGSAVVVDSSTAGAKATSSADSGLRGFEAAVKLLPTDAQPTVEMADLTRFGRALRGSREHKLLMFVIAKVGDGKAGSEGEEGGG